MGEGQSSVEYLFMIAVGLIILALVLHYMYTSSRGTPITGVAYIDPELSPEKPGYDHPGTWVVYKYPPDCLCNGATGVWNFPEDRGKNKINGVYLKESDFPCALYVTAWRR